MSTATVAPVQNTIPEEVIEERPCLELPGEKAVGDFRAALQKYPNHEKLSFTLGRAVVSSNGATLLGSGHSIDAKAIERFEKRTESADSGLVLVADENLLSVMRHVVRDAYEKAFTYHKQENRMLSYLFVKTDTAIDGFVTCLGRKFDYIRPVFDLVLHGDPALSDHLLHCSLFCVGLSARHKRITSLSREERINHHIRAMLAGLFSDISLAGSEFSIDHDQGAGHAAQSARLAEQAGLPEDVCDAIRVSHFYENREKLPPGNLLANFVSLYEYYQGSLQRARGTKRNFDEDAHLQQFFFDQGILSELEFFDKGTVEALAASCEEFQQSNREGAQVARVTEHCPFRDSDGTHAIPYPYERHVTQILCRANTGACKFYENKECETGKVYFAKGTKLGNAVTGVAIKPGYYGKCSLERLLPANRAQ